MTMRRGMRLLVVFILGLMLGQLGISAAQDQERSKKINPYTGNPDAIKDGRKLFIQFGCSGCHGVGGGGGMGVPLIDDEWKFGSDDETLFRLLKGRIPQQTMPSFGDALEDDQAWKILAYVRSLYRSDPNKVDW